MGKVWFDIDIVGYIGQMFAVVAAGTKPIGRCFCTLGPYSIKINPG
jgi:hypothetical protein